MTWKDFSIIVLGKERNELNEWARTRNLAYIVYLSSTTEKSPKSMKAFWSIPELDQTDVDEEKVYNDKLYSYDQISPNDLTSLKTSISSKRPVVISIPCYENCWSNAVLQNGVWSGYYSGEMKGGHAMCVIGYDDNKGGGAFEVMNSWGEDWGDNGFFWITYDDFTKHVNDCYALIGKKNK